MSDISYSKIAINLFQIYIDENFDSRFFWNLLKLNSKTRIKKTEM